MYRFCVDYTLFFKALFALLWCSFLFFSTGFAQQGELLEDKQQIVDDSVLGIPPPQVNYTAFGLLIQDIPPLWRDMWQGTNQGSVVELIEQSSNSRDLPTMNNLLHRLLISASYPPYTPEGSLKSNLPYARARIEWLIDRGYASDGLRLIGFIPEEHRFAWFGGALIDLNFADNDYAKVCAYIERSDLQDMRDSFYRDKVRIFCSLLAGDVQEAEFLFAIYADSKEEAGVGDDLFNELVNYSLFGILPQDGHFNVELSQVRPLHVSMLASTGIEFYLRDTSVEVSPLLLGMLSRANNLSLEERILMAERLLVVQPKEPAQLRNLYALFALRLLSENENITPDDENLPISHKLALIYAGVTADKYENQKALRLRQALTLGERDGRWYAVVRLLEAELVSLPVSNALAWFAPEMIRALLGLGEVKAARSWYHVLDEDSLYKRGVFSLLLSFESESGDGQAFISSGALWAKDVVSKGNHATTDELLLFDTLLAIYEWRVAKNDTEVRAELSSLRDMWFGYNPDLFTKSLTVEQPLWSLVSFFESAIANNREGQAVLLADLLLSAYFVLPPATLVRVLEGLEVMGLEKEAVAIAREYTLLYLYRQ